MQNIVVSIKHLSAAFTVKHRKISASTFNSLLSQMFDMTDIYNRLMGMCRWMGSHFHDWIDYNGVAFSIELLEWGRIFSGFGGKNIQASREFVF